MEWELIILLLSKSVELSTIDYKIAQSVYRATKLQRFLDQDRSGS